MTTDKDEINKIKSAVSVLKSMCREMHRVSQGREMVCLDCPCYRNDGRHEYCLLWRNSDMFLNIRDIE